MEITRSEKSLEIKFDRMIRRILFYSIGIVMKYDVVLYFANI